MKETLYILTNSESTSSGAIVQIIEVLALPPRAGWSIRVNLLSRYGIWALDGMGQSFLNQKEI